jgi:hypothetical protein
VLCCSPLAGLPAAAQRDLAAARCRLALLSLVALLTSLSSFLSSPLQEEDPEKYVTHFASYVKAGLDSEELEDLYTKVR